MGIANQLTVIIGNIVRCRDYRKHIMSYVEKYIIENK